MALDYGISDVCVVTVRDGNGNIVAEFPEAKIKFKEDKKVELTREQAISEFRKHWQWQADMGKAYAFIRASRKVQDAMEKKLRGE